MKKFKDYGTPIFIGLLLIAFFIGMAYGFSQIPNLFVWEKTILLIIPTFLCIVAIGATIQRIKEIKKGEEDDSRKY